MLEKKLKSAKKKRSEKIEIKAKRLTKSPKNINEKSIPARIVLDKSTMKTAIKTLSKVKNTRNDSASSNSSYTSSSTSSATSNTSISTNPSINDKKLQRLKQYST